MWAVAGSDGLSSPSGASIPRYVETALLSPAGAGLPFGRLPGLLRYMLGQGLPGLLGYMPGQGASPWAGRPARASVPARGWLAGSSPLMGEDRWA